MTLIEKLKQIGTSFGGRSGQPDDNRGHQAPEEPGINSDDTWGKTGAKDPDDGTPQTF